MAKTVGLTFNEKPITIEPPADYCENENVIDYKSMTVPELKAYAAELGIDLGSASKKDAIIQEIVDCSCGRGYDKRNGGVGYGLC